ncbi:GspE/PulE family protein [uncultured Ramlibacter sp.]|uniref:GspE/PulE family protein n=1 Tax=uncultured Ramlibacter sp. TaxID=260755 RepID=UPI00262AD39F|nr:GspE/PulE family protein [uncultured Ramlibacter sp.]
MASSSASAQSPSGDGVAWLDRVMRRIRPADAVLPVLPPALEEAWHTVALTCGLSSAQLAQEVARQSGLRSESLPALLSPEAVAWLRAPAARNVYAVPVRKEEGYLVIAVCNPTVPDLLERLRFASDMPVEVVIAPPEDIRRARDSLLDDIGGGVGSARSIAAAEGTLGQGLGGGEFHVEDRGSDAPVVRLCDMMLRQAILHQASDIHAQPLGASGLVRMRVDGRLRKAGRLPLDVLQRLIARVKAVAGMDPTDRMHPQDGRARAFLDKKMLDLRISTLPVSGGEKLVIRLLGGHSVLQLDDLDLPEVERRQVQHLVDASMGMVLVAGPTGSGKTTTLYSVLNAKNDPDLSIVTVEDPVEIRMPMLAQIEVNPRAGLDFVNALRSVVRQDPDIVLIGEIRDAETAGIAMQAAITGHLVFASIHANDAVSVLPRLGKLGVDTNLAAEAVRGVISQRLLRTLCPRCARPAQAPWTPAESWLMAHAGLQGSLRAVGCGACAGSGYKGRCSFMQVLTVTQEVAGLLDHGAPLSAVRALARQQGMRTLAESALDRVRRGQTSVEEVLREMGTDFWRDAAMAFGTPAPQEAIRASGLPAPAEDHGAAMLMVRDEKWRKVLRDWFQQLGWRIVEAATEDEVRAIMQDDADFGLAVIDLEQLRPDRMRAMFELRASMGGTFLPGLFFEHPGYEEFHLYIRQQARVLLAPRPHSITQLGQQIEYALSS